MIIELNETGNNLLGFSNRLFAQSSIKADAQIFHWGDKWSQNIVAVTITTHMYTLGMESMILTVLSPTQRSVRLKYFAVVTACNFDIVRYFLCLDSFSHRNLQPGWFMNCRREAVEKSVPPGNPRELDPRRT